MSLAIINGLLVITGAFVIGFIVLMLTSYFSLKVWNCFCEAGKINLPINININLKSVTSFSVFVFLLENTPKFSELFISG